MGFPEFFDAVPRVRLRDPLAALLGAAEDGVLEYAYADAVRLAGHSCPTVASAYWLTARALKALYGDAMPVRGEVRVSLREAAQAGTAGVTASVVGLLTGAAAEGGFKGLQGQYVRRDLLAFDLREQATDLCFTRSDTGARVLAQAWPQRVPAEPGMVALMQACLAGDASGEERERFGRLWQARVRRLLLDHAYDGEIFSLQHVVA